jgi:hypothetical protein
MGSVSRFRFRVSRFGLSVPPPRVSRPCPAAALAIVKSPGSINSELAVIELLPRQAEVFDNVGDDTARHVTAVPREGDEALGVKRIRVVAMAASGPQ